MSPRPGPSPLLLLVLCYLMLRPALGFPVRGGAASRRELAKSASGDDLISGSDFLSVFIGASITPRSGRPRGPNSRGDPDQSISSFGERTVPRHTNTLASDGESRAQDKSEIERIEDLSHSNPPSDELVSFASENKGRYPLPVSSSRAVNFSDSDIDAQSDSTADSNIRDDPSGSDTSDVSADATSAHSKPAFTTVESTVQDSSSHSSDSNSEPRVTTTLSSQSDYTVVTDIVTSQEELLPPTVSSDLLISHEPSTQDHESSESNSNPQTYSELNDHQQHEHAEINYPQNRSEDSNVDKDADEEFDNTQEESQNSSSLSVTPSSVHVHYSSTAGISPPGKVSTPEFSTIPTESTRVTITGETDTNSRQESQPVQQVVSVRVSSSVVQGPSAAPYVSRYKGSRFEHGEVVPKTYVLTRSAEVAVSDEDMQKQIDRDISGSTGQTTHTEIASINVPQPQPVSTSLVTEDEPAATAVQRSHFIVEEASPSSSEVSAHRQSPSIGNLQDKIIATVVETTRGPHAPVSYHTSVSSATSGSRIRFYSNPQSYHRGPSSAAETVQSTVVTRHQGSSAPHYERVLGGALSERQDMPIESHMGRYGEPHHDVRISNPSLHQHDSLGTVPQSHPLTQQVKSESSREQKSYQPRHQEPVEMNYETQEQNYGQPEQVYGVPERNYEVDEAVSVMSNGRVHGPQPTTPAGADPNKFGYVVEGQNFRKYRVEERTPDGFIVGEYGVVSHDDGSLRGVRYTADGTINPSVIYDALVKFLSL